MKNFPFFSVLKKRMTQANVELVGASLGQAATFQEKVHCKPNVIQQTFTAIPSSVSWGQTCRALCPGGGVLNLPGDIKMFQNVRLSFSVSIGPVTAEIMGAHYNSLQILQAIESIECLIDEQSVYHLERGSIGTLALKYQNSVIKRTGDLSAKVYGIFPHISGPTLRRVRGVNCSEPVRPPPAGSTAVEFSIPLDFLFDDLFNNVDSRWDGSGSWSFSW